MTLFKTSLLTGFAVAIKMLTLLGLNKILAIYVGPSGFASLGQFQSGVQLVTTLASGAINTGVTKYTAEYHEDEVKQHDVWRTAGSISLAGSALVAVLVISLNKPLAGWLLNDESLGSVFIWFSSTLVLFVFNTLFLAILNGKKEIHRYVTANIAGSVFALVVTTSMAIKMGLYGALVALAIYQSLTFFVTLWLILKAKWFKISYIFGRIDRRSAKNLSKFAVMALVSSACVPLSHIMIRNHLGETLGSDAAGSWEAMWRLSAAYLMFVTSALSVYYLPKLSELQDAVAIKREIVAGYKFILPLAAICGLAIFLLRDTIIQVLFTDEFAGMEPLFGWQMIGDLLKIASWLLGYVLTAKAFTGLFVISEILFSMLFVFLVYSLSPTWGLEASALAYAINYLLHLVFMYTALKIKRVI